ncbi:MAG: hypothetical protein N4A40_12785 [Tissierellales bacterium]|jgi:hypothetical protein|nr:hypothetical protein [Tissierellales bacterium]
MKQIITYFGKQVWAECDRKCNKAWGKSSRPKYLLNKEDPDEFCYATDDELGQAPLNPGTYENGEAKQYFGSELNTWCIRECERCSKSSSLEEDPILSDFSKRIYNNIDKHIIEGEYVFAYLYRADGMHSPMIKIKSDYVSVFELIKRTSNCTKVIFTDRGDNLVMEVIDGQIYRSLSEQIYNYYQTYIPQEKFDLQILHWGVEDSKNRREIMEPFLIENFGIEKLTK